jgi:hypothetical protein
MVHYFAVQLDEALVDPSRAQLAVSAQVMARDSLLGDLVGIRNKS